MILPRRLVTDTYEIDEDGKRFYTESFGFKPFNLDEFMILKENSLKLYLSVLFRNLKREPLFHKDFAVTGYKNKGSYMRTVKQLTKKDYINFDTEKCYMNFMPLSVRDRRQIWFCAEDAEIELKANSLLVLLLLRYWDTPKNHEAFGRFNVTNEVLSDKTSLSLAIIKRSLKELEEKGYIERFTRMASKDEVLKMNGRCVPGKIIKIRTLKINYRD